MNGVEKMEARLQKWGNSIGIRIPNSILKDLNLKVNDILVFKQEDDKIIMSIKKDKKISLKDRFENYEGDCVSESFDWGEPMGKEIW